MNIPNYPHVAPGRFVALAGSQNGGRVLEWYQCLVGAGHIDDLLSELVDMPAMPILVPHLAGSGSALQDDAAMGVIAGLTFDVTRPEITRAVLEGITFDQRIALDNLQQNGFAIDALTAVGGGTRSGQWLQIKSDILGIPIRTLKHGAAACAGAAMLAGMGSGALANLESAISAFVRPASEFRPRPQFAAFYDRKASSYRSVYDAMQPTWKRLREMTSDLSAFKKERR